MINSNHNKDLAPERQERLRDIIRQTGVARVDDLCEELGVSPATVRRDLEALEQAGRIRRVHGGAVSVESRLDEPLFDDKTSIAARQKRSIAECALREIATGDTLYLDGGSTVLELARLLTERTDLTVVTNSLRAAVELSGAGPQLILVGGELRRRSQTVVGSLTRLLLDQIHVDKAFMGTIGLSIEEGVTTTDPNEAYTKERVLAHAGRVYLLADSSKMEKVSFSQAGTLDQIDVLIADQGLSGEFQNQIEKHDIRVLLA